MVAKTVNLIGYASSLGSANTGYANGPLVMRQSPFMFILNEKGLYSEWRSIYKPELAVGSDLDKIAHLSQTLAKDICSLSQHKKYFTVIGGDHSSAIGTWSGTSHAIKNQGALGLIWIDAHMDSCVPKATPSKNIHSMSLACLLGYGDASLTNILNSEPKIKPEHLCLIGVRSYKETESEFLKNLGVRIFYIDEVNERGLDVVMQEAIKIAAQDTAGFGVSIDLHSIDPSKAPGTDAPIPNGLHSRDLLKSLENLTREPHLLGLEIVEFDPFHDKNQMTEKLIPQLIASAIATD